MSEYYTISSGTTSGDYRIDAFLTGPDGANLKALYNEFRQQVGLNAGLDYDARRVLEREWAERLEVEGFTSWSILFASWLEKERGFQRLTPDEFNTDD